MRIILDSGALCHESQIADALLARVREQIDPDASIEDRQIRFALRLPAARKGRTLAPADRKQHSREQAASMADLVRLAHRKLLEHDASPLEPGGHAAMRAPADAWTRDRISVGLLAPDIQKALIQGTIPAAIHPDDLVGRDFPLDWAEQRRVLGMAE